MQLYSKYYIYADDYLLICIPKFNFDFCPILHLLTLVTFSLNPHLYLDNEQMSQVCLLLSGTTKFSHLNLFSHSLSQISE